MTIDQTFAPTGKNQPFRAKALRTVTVIGSQSGWLTWEPGCTAAANENGRGAGRHQDRG